MKKIRHFLTKLKMSLKKHLTPKAIVKRRLPKFILIIWLIILLVHGAFAAWRIYREPAMKIFPQISLYEFLQQMAERKIDYLYFKYIYNDAEVPDFKADKIKILAQLKDGVVVAVDSVNFSQLNYIQFLTKIEASEIGGVLILLRSENAIFGWSEAGTIFISNFSSLISEPEELSKILREKSVPYWEFSVQEIKESNFDRKWLSLMLFFVNIGGFLLFIAVFNKNVREKEAAALKAAAKSSKPKTTFKDVAGIDEAKEDVMEVLEFIKSPEKYIKHGAQLPRGILLVGPPGCGKTLLARALASEANVPFKSAAGSEFIEKYVGIGAERIRKLFHEVKEMARAQNTAVILFIDEIDALGTRSETPEMGEMEQAQTIAQILHEMDGFEPAEKIFVIGATNRPENLDPAIRRPGRFDRQIIVQLPDLKGREAILKVHCKNKKIVDSIDFRKVAELTPLGFSGADLANAANEAAIRAAKFDKEKIEMIDFEKAVEKVMMGSERKSAVMNNKDKWRTAYHETGHVIVAKFTVGADPPEKVSIIPTTKGVGGFTRTSQKEEKYYWTKQELLARIQVLFGGRIAEEMIYGSDQISTGAKEDFGEATHIAEQMVCDFGMASEFLGPRTFGAVSGSQYLGRTSRRQDYSEEMARAVDEAKKNILTRCYDEAKTNLELHRDKLKLFAKILKRKETLGAEEINHLLK